MPEVKFMAVTRSTGPTPTPSLASLHRAVPTVQPENVKTNGETSAHIAIVGGGVYGTSLAF